MLFLAPTLAIDSTIFYPTTTNAEDKIKYAPTELVELPESSDDAQFQFNKQIKCNNLLTASSIFCK